MISVTVSQNPSPAHSFNFLGSYTKLCVTRAGSAITACYNWHCWGWFKTVQWSYSCTGSGIWDSQISANSLSLHCIAIFRYTLKFLWEVIQEIKRGLTRKPGLTRNSVQDFTHKNNFSRILQITPQTLHSIFCGFLTEEAKYLLFYKPDSTKISC